MQIETNQQMQDCVEKETYYWDKMYHKQLLIKKVYKRHGGRKARQMLMKLQRKFTFSNELKPNLPRTSKWIPHTEQEMQLVPSLL